MSGIVYEPLRCKRTEPAEEGSRAEGLLAARPDRGAARRLRCLPGRAGDGHHVALGLRQNARELADLGGLYRTVSVHHGERASR